MISNKQKKCPHFYVNFLCSKFFGDITFWGAHLPKQAFLLNKNEQFLKYQKIECLYHRLSENSFNNFFVEKSLRSGGFFIYYYGYEVKFCDITIICLKRIFTMFQMSQNLDMFFPKDPWDVFG